MMLGLMRLGRRGSISGSLGRKEGRKKGRMDGRTGLLLHSAMIRALTSVTAIICLSTAADRTRAKKKTPRITTELNPIHCSSP